MAEAQIDPASYTADQRRGWDAAAGGWQRWWPALERGMQPVCDRMLDLARIGPGQRVLDVATGIGEPALSAAARVGATGHVVAADLSPVMLGIAHQRVRQAALRNVELVEADAEAVALPAASFDAVLCRFGLMFLADPGRGLAHLRSLLKRDGRLAAATWGAPSQVPMISVSMAAVVRALALTPPPAEQRGAFRLSDAGALARLVSAAGFAEVTVETVETSLHLPTAADYVQYCQDVSDTLRRLLAGEPPARLELAWQAVAQAAAPFTQADGSIVMRNQALVIGGRNP